MMADSATISKKDLDNLKEQLEHMPRDRDRIRLITAATESHRFSCVRRRSGIQLFFFWKEGEKLCWPIRLCLFCAKAQVSELVAVQHFGDAKTMTAVLCHPRLVDPENFERVVLAAYPFAEDKEEVKKALKLWSKQASRHNRGNNKANTLSFALKFVLISFSCLWVKKKYMYLNFLSFSDLAWTTCPFQGSRLPIKIINDWLFA